MQSGVVFLLILKCSIRFFDSLSGCSNAILPLVLGMVLVPLTHAHAHEDNAPVFDQFSISASARGEVSNDLLTAQLVVEHEDRDSATLANRVNADMTWALEQVRQHPAVKAKSGTYNTWPQYERKQNKVIGWRSRQVLKIESDDFDAARKAIKVLQERLQMNGLQLMAKPETREAQVDELIAEALNAFRKRAGLVQSSMGSTGYRVINVDIHTDSRFHQQSIHRNYAAEGIASSQVVNEPAIAAGSSEVVVSVSGRIQLQ